MGAEEGSGADFRELAVRHHEAAGRLLASGVPAEARYACLELRMALECLVYDLLKLYRDDVSDDVLEMWQANRILDALLKTDPGIEHGIELHIPGEAGDFDDLVIDWREERLRVKWATKAYHSLGHFLHERTFAELTRGTQDDPAKVLVRARAIHVELDRVLASTGWNLRLSTRFAMDCDCGARAEFAMSPKQLKSRARCSACGADYEVENLAADPRRIRTRRWSGR
ncbi:hypothetical protein [Brevundimonas naejangsanensis]|uniref:hypothetical protein n=1 Tax=Brevundimonas naejangsanensis TaxID=588932 RepID=UPI00320869B5